ncbi:serine/threonine-protein kinase [Kutzneria sp. NPDC052558]|uniref:serine/threonine-protein kinase n=1 Tax=Kutzneria sp. NPDC052558 TaxID=3364121 RepID=UPI0037CB2B2A
MTTGEHCGQPPVAGRYALVRTLGTGGMGTVWLARDLLLGRDVAVKDVTGQGERVLHEARAAARVVHPNVVTVYDVVAHDDRQWIVMQHVESRTLAEVITVDGALPPQRVAEIGLDLLAGLLAAHASGVLHRDVKPGNVLLDGQGRAFLADFGIASAEGDTSSGVLVGAPGFMAPERIQGLAAGPESDFWSLGVTLYAAVEGAVPFDRGEALATMTSVLTDPLPPPVRAGPLGPLLIRLLDKDPAARPTAEEIYAALSGAAVVQATVPVTAPTPLVQAVAARRRRRAPMAVGAVGLAAAIGALLFVLRPAPPVVPAQTPAAPPIAATTSHDADPIAPVQVKTTTRKPTSTPTSTTTTTVTTTTTTTAPPTTTTTTSTAPPASTTVTTTDQTSVLPTS